METKGNENLLSKLERSLEQYNTIFLFVSEQEDSISFDELLSKLKAEDLNRRKAMLISAKMINKKPPHYQIAKYDREKMMHLFYTYEFSDKFHVISTESNYANINHLIDTNILTPEEAWQALLS